MAARCGRRPLGHRSAARGRATFATLRDARRARMNRTNLVAFSTFAAPLVAWPFDALAQDLEPRLYTNVPLGMNFLGAGYGYSEGNVLVDPAVAFENARDRDRRARARLRPLGAARAVLGQGRRRDRARLSRRLRRLRRPTRHAQRLRLTDARARMTVNFLGAPPLRRQEFASYRQDWVFGASLQLGLPVGDYDPARLVNIGTNRQSAKLELGVSKNLSQWLLEVSFADTLYEDNTQLLRRPRPRARVDHVAAGARRLSVLFGYLARRSTRLAITAVRLRRTACAATRPAVERQISVSRRRCRSTRSNP